MCSKSFLPPSDFRNFREKTCVSEVSLLKLTQLQSVFSETRRAVRLLQQPDGFFLCGHHNANASAVFGGSFAPILRFEKLEIHKVFLHFPNLVLKQNLSPNALADLRCAALSSATSIPVPALRPFVDAHGVGFASVRWLLLQRRGILPRRVSSLEMGVKFSRYRATFR